jgi:hypothetical protein
MNRTDLAAPTIIDPAAFTFAGGVYLRSHVSEDFDAVLGDWMREHDASGQYEWFNTRAAILKDRAMLNADGNFVRKSTCDHCGARFTWGALYRHDSGAFIVVGNTCAERTLSYPSRYALEVGRLESRLRVERVRLKNRASARKQATEQDFAWLYAEKHSDRLLADIAAKGLQYGSLSVRQIELIKRVHTGEKPQWMIERDARVAQRAADEAAAVPVPLTTERVKVSGVILATKDQPGYLPHQTVLKMLVRAIEGYKVWGTFPRELDAAVGSKVEFFAKIERSDKDPKFGFFSRPTKARVIEEVAA